MKILGTMIAFVVSLCVMAPAFAAKAGEGSGKGTIGIVCIDPAGEFHFWNSEFNDQYESCVDQVVNSWIVEDSGKAPALDDLIEGIDRYRQVVARLKAQPKEKK
jgi:hypothetical protein